MKGVWLEIERADDERHGNVSVGSALHQELSANAFDQIEQAEQVGHVDRAIRDALHTFEDAGRDVEPESVSEQSEQNEPSPDELAEWLADDQADDQRYPQFRDEVIENVGVRIVDAIYSSTGGSGAALTWNAVMPLAWRSMSTLFEDDRPSFVATDEDLGVTYYLRPDSEGYGIYLARGRGKGRRHGDVARDLEHAKARAEQHAREARRGRRRRQY